MTKLKDLSKVPTDISLLSCGPKISKILKILGAISPVQHVKKSTHIIGITPILEMARDYGLRPRLCLLLRLN